MLLLHGLIYLSVVKSHTKLIYRYQKHWYFIQKHYWMVNKLFDKMYLLIMSVVSYRA